MNSDKEKELLEEIRENFQICTEEWAEIRDEATKDMRYLTGDPWDPSERKAREDAKRPCLALDELTQYTNKLINNWRQNKRGIKIDPDGDGATKQTAEFRENKIRRIEYDSKAQAAYITGYENAVNRSYGFWRVTTGYVDEDSFEQEIHIKRIPNPDTVWPDPSFKEADSSDMEFCFVTDLMKKKEFARRWPNARKVNFEPEDVRSAPQWIKANEIQVAEYWKVVKETRTKMQLDDDGKTAFLDQYQEAELDGNSLMSKGKKLGTVKNRKKAVRRKVVQYITNGVEILEENEWPGKWIPIIGVFGKEMYLDAGSGSKRVIFSLVRLARDPQMLYNYYRTREAEEAALAPLSPFMLYEGQQEGHEDEWAQANKMPMPYLQAKGKTEGTGDEVLPLPSRQQFIPNFQGFEAAAEAARRAIQAAMGISPLPTTAQRQNEKSGVALQRIETQEDVGSFHFPDNMARSLEHTGRVIDDLFEHIYDTPREEGVQKADGTAATIKINDPTANVGQDGNPVHYPTDIGRHNVTISTGPSYQSQREAASDFVDTIIGNIEQLPIDPVVKAKFMALLIKLKDLGPLGDQMAELLDPEGQNAQTASQLAQAQQKAQQQQQIMAEMQADLEKLRLEKQAKIIEMAGRKDIEQMKLEVQLAVSEVSTKAQSLNERLSLVGDLLKQFHAQAHDLGMQQHQQQHESDQAQLAQAAAMQQATAQPEQQPAQ